MSQQTRIFLFFVLAMGTMMLWSQFVAPPPPPPGSETVKPVPTPQPPSGTAEPRGGENLSVQPVRATKSIPLTETTLETQDYVATFSNQGAVLKSFLLKKHKNRKTGKPLQLVDANGAIRPFTLSYPSLPDLNRQVFEVKGSSRNLTGEEEETRLVYRLSTTGGTVVEKTFTLRNKSYLIGLDVSVRQQSGRGLPSSDLTLEWPADLGHEEFTEANSTGYEGIRVAVLAGPKIHSEKAKKSRETVGIPGPITWASIADQFFMAALIPDPASGGTSVRILRDTNALMAGKKATDPPVPDPKVFTPRPALVFQAPALKAGESFTRKLQAYVGPQNFDQLKSLNLQLEGVVDLGMFGFISVYMLKILNWFYSLIPNWGLAIILLSILVKLVLWWPTHSTYKQMNENSRKMKEIQPKIDAIKRKYPTDMQKQNQETMALYQSANINLMGGCLPMLLQMPVFFALYSTLAHAIELRGAPFFLWIQDLSVKDPVGVFPILMGISMLVQQRLSGQSMPASGQQKFMLWFFPVFLTFISFQWPSGLLLYWVVTNVLSIWQQKMVYRSMQSAAVSK